MTRLALIPLLLLTCALSVGGQERWVVVVDRSGSMRIGDPEGQGLEALGLALVLAADADAEVEVYDSQDASFKLSEGPDRLLQHLASLSPRAGGADLVERLERARSGEGRVVLYTDDALDVIDVQGRAPERWLRAAGDAPTRERVNAAAREALAQGSGAQVLALRAPLPDAARATPFLESLNAEVVDLRPDDPQRAVTAMATLLSGKPVMDPIQLDAAQSRLAPGFPARALIRTQRPLALEGRKLDSRGTLWLIEVPEAGLDLGEHGGAVCYLAPTVRLPTDLAAYGLGAVLRAQAGSAPPGGQLVLRADGAEFPFEGNPPAVDARATAKKQVEVVLKVGESGFVADSRSVEVLPVTLRLSAEGSAQVGHPLLLRGRLPAGYAPREPIRLALRCGSAEETELVLDADLTASFTPEVAGRLSASARGPLPVEFKGPNVAPPLGPTRLRLAVSHGGATSSLGQMLKVEGEELELQVQVTVEPPYEAPVKASFSLEGGEGVTLVAEPFEISDQASATVRLRWAGSPGDKADLTLVATTASAAPATGRHTLHLLKPVDLIRRYLGLALILLAVIAVGAYFLQRRFRAYMAQRMGTRQIRGIDAEGKISVERYNFLENSREDEVVEIAPELLSQSSVELIVEDDGSVRASISGRAKLIHERDPSELLDSTPLKHGDSFAVVEGNRARRFVYLDDEPSADELERSVASDRVSAEAELRDSGVYVLLDENQNVAPVASVLDAKSEDLFPSSEDIDPIGLPPLPLPGLAGIEGDEIEDSVDEMAFVPLSEEGPMVSDEGVVWLGSDEAEILDSDEAATIEADTDVTDLPKGL